METPKNCKSATSAKFIIKARPSGTHLRSQNSDPEAPANLDQEVELFLTYMKQKSRRLKDLLQEKGVTRQQDFFQRYFLKSVTLKTMLKSIMDRMFNDRRLGHNLKGMNRDNAVEIQNQIWSCLKREVQLYLNEAEYQKGKKQLENILAQRKNEIVLELSRLRAQKTDGQKEENKRSESKKEEKRNTDRRKKTGIVRNR